jgi:hypothetical protein
MVEALCYKPEGFPMRPLIFFNLLGMQQTI